MSFSYPDRTVEIQSLHARVAEMEADAKRREDLIQDNRERIQGLKTRVAELEAVLRRVDVYFQHTGKAGDLPVSVHALLPKLITRHEDGTETAVTPLPMWQP